MAEYPFWAATRTVREGLSGRAGLAAYRAAGGRIQDATWFRMVSEARATVAARGVEVGRPLNRRPHADEMTPWTTRRQRGVIQQVEVFVRDRATGEVIAVPYSHRTQTGTIRQNAVNAAIEFVADGAKDYDQVVLGAVHVGTYRMAPGG